MHPSTGPYTCQRIALSSCIYTHTHHEAVLSVRDPDESHGDRVDVDHRFLEGGEDIHLTVVPGPAAVGAADTPLVLHCDASIRQRYFPPARTLKTSARPHYSRPCLSVVFAKNHFHEQVEIPNR